MPIVFYILTVILLFPCSARSETQHIEKVSLDFLYVNANSGEAAGGHSAFRLGESVFHYQFFPDSTFMIVRDPWDSFRFLYTELHNRTISKASLTIEPDAFNEIKHYFTTLLIEQEQFFTAIEALQTELDLVHAMDSGQGTVAIPCLGFFDLEVTSSGHSPLLHKIRTQLGPDFLNQELLTIGNEIQNFTSQQDTDQTLLEALTYQQALQVIHHNTPLNTTILIPPLHDQTPLYDYELTRLHHFIDRQEQGIVNLLQSARPDKGQALLLQIARYLAVDHSSKTKKLYTLDPFPDAANTVTLNQTEISATSLGFLQTDLKEKASQYRSHFFQQKEYSEFSYSRLEANRARAFELRQAGIRTREVRILPKVKLPSRSGRVVLKQLPRQQDYTTQVAQRINHELAALQKIRTEKYSYNLFQRNCATKLIHTLNASFLSKETGESVLGGWLEPNGGLRFIPFILYDQSTTAFKLQDEEIITARRLRHLHDQYATENDFLVWLRESNTLSSTLYEPRTKDTPFLFFTDDGILLRPLEGIFNLSYATLHGVAGLFTLPFDGGERIHQAGRGMFYSLPELFFATIRKGTYPTGEPTH